MTLNQVIKRIETLALNHAQIRSFYRGSVTDFLNDKTTRYAACFLQDSPGNIDVAGNSLNLNFKLFLLDLVNVSENPKANELDVQSDMLSVAADLIALMDDSVYSNWRIGQTSPFNLVKEELDDMVAGVVADITISIPYIKDICAVPTNS